MSSWVGYRPTETTLLLKEVDGLSVAHTCRWLPENDNNK